MYMLSNQLFKNFNFEYIGYVTLQNLICCSHRYFGKVSSTTKQIQYYCVRVWLVNIKTYYHKCRYINLR